MSAAFRRRKHRGDEPTGKLVLEWQRAGLGRYYRALLDPTPANAKLLRRLKEMFNVLADTDLGRPLIRAMLGPLSSARRRRRRTKEELALCLHPLDVWRAYKHSRLHELPTPEQLLPLAPALTIWRDGTTGEDLLDIRKQVVRILAAEAHHRLKDLPALTSAAMRRKAETPVLANRVKEQVTTFLIQTQGEKCALLDEVRLLAEIPIPQGHARPKVHLTPQDFWALAPELGDVWPIFRDMTLTGTIQKEFYGPWRMEGLGVWIAGSKTAYRQRWVPLIQPIERPCGSQEQLMAACRKVGKRLPGFRPYTARHTFSRWIQEAGIPPWRQAMLMGHSARELARLGLAVAQTVEYQMGDILRYLPGDVAALRNLLGLPPLPAHVEKLA